MENDKKKQPQPMVRTVSKENRLQVKTNILKRHSSRQQCLILLKGGKV